MSDSSFVHLHVHSDYSLLDGACRIDRLFSRAHELGMPAVSITDHGNLFALPDFYQTAEKYQIKPLLGCELYLVHDHAMTEKPERALHKYYHMGVLARNFTGYRNLTKMVSKAHLKGMYYKPRVDMETLAQHAEGLIGFTGCLQGVVPQAILRGDEAGARAATDQFIQIFGREAFFVEIQDHGIPEQRSIIPSLLKIAEEFNLKVICSNDVHYVERDDWRPHDSLLCIQTGAKLSDEKRMRYDSREFFLKSRQEMEQVFAEVPQSITNTLAVAEMCDLKLPFNENHYPVFTVPPEIKVPASRKLDQLLDDYIELKNNLNEQSGDSERITIDEETRQRIRVNGIYLLEQCKAGLLDRYGVNYDDPASYQPKEGEPANRAQELCQRIDYELSVIAGTGFVDYFLIVWDFIHWARNRNIPVGPGRGSGAGCLVAYVLKITDIDPLRFGLLFERFLNPERVSPPDFDIDFCMRRRDDVVDYVRNKYGEDSVANIITFGTFGAKMVIRDLARVNNIALADADRLAKMIPDDVGITMESALKKSSELQGELRYNEHAQMIFEQGKVIEGMVRNTGKHACGIIISDRPLTELIPVTLQEGNLTTQFAKDPVEKLGLLKMDFLGLKTLTVIDDAQTNVQRTRNLPDFDIESVDFDDSKTFQLLNEARTVGVFQLESGGMQALCRQFNLSSIDEIVALIALYRPGPMEWIPDYLRGKNDPSTIKFPHPLLETICAETYGIMVYQEQVMEAARRIAGYTLGGADILRRAMGKKQPEVMAEQREIFVKGAAETNQIDKTKAEEIFAILEKFAGYGFNKSHSAAYAILAYRTAYLKANYPVEFMAAVLSSELGNADKVAHFIDEASAMRIDVLGPDINESWQMFTPIPAADESRSGSIRFGLAAIRNVGDGAARNIIGEREENGPYKDLSDFSRRVDPKTVNRRVYEALIKSGAFDGMGIDRQHLLQSLDLIMSDAASYHKDKQSGQTLLFDMLADDNSDDNAALSIIHTDGPEMQLADKLQMERELLGFYLSGHPMNAYAGLDEAANTIQPDRLPQSTERTPFRFCGVILSVTKKVSKRDNRPWAFFSLANKRHTLQANLFSEAYEKHSAELVEGQTVMISGEFSWNPDRGEHRFNVDSIGPLDALIGSAVRSITFLLHPDEQQANNFLRRLSETIHSHEGFTRIAVAFHLGDDRVLQVELAESLRMKLIPAVIQQLRTDPAVVGLQVETTPPPQREPRWGRRQPAPA